MTKRRTKTAMRATKAQLRRIEEQGQRIYAFNWENAKKGIVPPNMTRDQAHSILYEFDKILGGST